MSGNERAGIYPERPCRLGCIVAVTVALLLLVAGIISGWLPAEACRDFLLPSGRFWEYAWVLLIGSLVGAAELLSRYRDSPWHALRSAPGMVFILFNGLCAVGALFFIMHFHNIFNITDTVVRVIIAGTGAMVVIRSKLFTLRQANGTDVAVGPAFAVDTFLAAVNREVDRTRAVERNKMAARWAERLRLYPFAVAKPFLTAAMSSLQDMDDDEAKKLGEALANLVDDPNLGQLSDQVRFYMIGFDILTVFGERAYESLFTEVEAYLRKAVATLPARAPEDG